MGQLTIPPSVLFRDLGGEAVLLELETGCYFGLDEIGTRIWRLIEKHGELPRVERELLEAYEVSPDHLAGDLSAFVRSLVSRGLLRAHEA